MSSNKKRKGKNRRNIPRKNSADLKNTYIIIFMSLVFVRILLTTLTSYQVDMGGYRAWSLHFATNGPANLYSTFHIVYAPAYLYLLYLSGKIATWFSLTPEAHAFFIKLWAVLFDFIGGYIIYLIGKKYKREKSGIILAIIYSLNPGVFFNSSIWGQFDSVPATMLLGVIYLFGEKKRALAVFLFLLAILTKPQSGLLAPIVLILFFKDFNLKDKLFRKSFLALLFGLPIIYLIITMPFYSPTPLFSSNSTFLAKLFDRFYWMYNLYRTSIDDYAYATANAFNFWTIMNAQAPVKDTQPFLGLTYSLWGFIFMGISIVFALLIVLRKSKKEPQILFYSSYIILFASFLFMTRMHERYLLPAIIFLTASVIWDKRLYFQLIILSTCVMANHWYIYELSFRKIFWISVKDPLAHIFAWITLLLFICSLYYGWKRYLSRPGLKKELKFRN